MYDHGFRIHHCPLAFNGDDECVYCLCDRCHIKETPTARSRKKHQKSPDDVVKGCKHDLFDLKLEDNESMLVRKNRAQQCKKMPGKCSKCQILL